MDDQLRDWTKRELSRSLAYPVEDTLVTHLLSMKTKKDIEEYVTDLLGNKAPDFVRQYMVLWSGHHSDVPMVEHRKRPEESLFLYADKKKQKPIRDKRNRGIPPPGLSQTGNAHHKSATKTKYVSLMSSEGQSKMVVQIPGRHACDCLAQKHILINNCLECGRVICDQEGAGPCLFCGNLVLTREEEQILTRDSKRAEKLKEKLLDKYNVSECVKPTRNEGLLVATEHKDKLLEFDRTSIKRTRVIDDESDYFTVHNQWISQEEKDALQEREDKLKLHKHGRSDRKITLDFAGRKVIEEDLTLEMYDEDNVKDILKQTSCVRRSVATTDTLPPSLTYLSKGVKAVDSKDKQAVEEGIAINRVQDRMLLEMADHGFCLSLHQPWASLLVRGIKRYEGRTWYTQHRGKLWIAAAAKQPQYSDIKSAEEFYTKLFNGKSLPFPSQYSTGCILGCVDLRDCLSQEEFKSEYPDGDSELPYVFICDNPKELRVKYPIKGKHKIWKLPPQVHSIVKQTLPQ